MAIELTYPLQIRINSIEKNSSTPCHTQNARLVQKSARQLLADMMQSRQWSPG